LLTAEKWSVVAHQVTGLPSPNDFKHAWKNVLFCQFHDILAGTSIESAYEDVLNFYGEALAIAGRNLNAAVQALAWRIHIDPEPAMQPILVFNSHTWCSKVPVELEINQPTEPIILVDNEDRVIQHQVVRSESAAPWRTRLFFIADLPPLGYRVYRLKPGEDEKAGNILRVSSTEIENEYFWLSFDAQTGWLMNLVDKRNNIDLLAGPAARPVVISDLSDTWSHYVFRFNDVIGDFTGASFQIIEQGPLKVTIRVANKYNLSTLIQDFTLYQGLDIIKVEVNVDWHESNKLLKLRFPFSVTATHTTYEIPYGHIKRSPNGEENPGLNWVDVSGVLAESQQLYGISLINDGKYSFDSQTQDTPNIHDIGLTVLRSPVYAHHLPMELDPRGIYNYMDQGRQSFQYAIYPHSGHWEEAGVVQRAAELNQSPFVILGTFHPEGSLPQVNSYLTVDNNNVVVSVLKQSEDTDGLILRCYETAGRAEHVNIVLKILDRSFSVDMKPCEIKTLLIPLNQSGEVKEVNMIEYEDKDYYAQK
jgi:alpha-mannosidase